MPLAEFVWALSTAEQGLRTLSPQQRGVDLRRDGAPDDSIGVPKLQGRKLPQEAPKSAQKVISRLPLSTHCHRELLLALVVVLLLCARQCLRVAPRQRRRARQPHSEAEV